VREITTHRIHVDETVRIFIADDPGSGGAHHHYQLSIQRPGQGQEIQSTQSIRFQHGPITGILNGVTNESLLAVVLDRLECFQKGEFSCTENKDAIKLLKAAMKALHSRTKDRIKRGVEGKLKK
jgi:hypothetical protein